jgi:NPCBM/NEW2 domain
MMLPRYQRRPPSRRNAFRPGAEGLEPRIVLSGAFVGVNLNVNSDVNGDPIWTDLHNLATAWTPASGSSLSLTSDGYPLANASTSFSASGYPDGDFEFSYTGGGTVSFSGAGELVGSVTVSDGVTSGTIVVNTLVNYGFVDMQVTNVSASDPMDNFHLMMPGYGNGTTSEPMFTPAFLQALAPFSDIRFMNWEKTNNSTLSDWSDRVQPNAFLTDGTGGVPYEDMITLANEAQKDMWINIPAEATPQFVQSLAQLIDSELDPNLNVYVEYGNEDWNSGFSAYSQIAAAAAANPLLNQSLSQSQLVAQQSAYEIVTDGQIFDQAFGSAGAARVRPILGAQASYDAFENYALQFIQQQFGAPSQYIYAVAVAPYISITSSENVSGLTLNQLFTDLEGYLDDQVVPWITADASLATQYDLPLVAYEGGQSLVPGANDLNFSVMQQAQDDPRMYQLYVQYMQDWEQAGGGLFNAYNFDGGGNQFGFWGLLPNVTVAGSQKYDALLSVMYPPGDADTDGTVDYADFQTVQANYGSDNAYWVQGDFNDDGAVNWTDLNILRQNLDPAGFTLDQFAQQALFGQLSQVDTPTALEYDGYGVTYASSLPLSSTSGTVKLNENSAGQAIDLGGATYSEGLGFAANSSTIIALNGQYSEFDSTIGVDSGGSTASSVIFEVYSAKQLLYESSVITAGSTPVPIDLNVTGLNSLTLIVEAAPGSTAANDHAVWADARLISTANFGSTQPYTMSWQLSQNGQVIASQTSDSFAFTALSGTYTLSLTVTNAQGSTGTASTTITVVPDDPSATLLLKDSVTEGNWVGTYGGQGYDLPGVSSILPASVNVSTSGASTYTWSSSTTETPGLENPDGVGGTAYTWYGTTITINVNLIDGQEHDLTLYALDWGNDGRSEEIQVINATTGSVLSTETISSFANGVYLQWAVSGSIEIKVTTLSGANAVISGLFLDTPPAEPASIVQRDALTEGSWMDNYGTQGYDIEGETSNLPSYASVSFSGATPYTWTSSTTDTPALENPSGFGRIATAWYSETSFTINVNVTAGQAYDLALYALDWDNDGRSEEIQLINPSTGSVLDTEIISSFSNGDYLQWDLTGSVQIVVTKIGGDNAVISGLFFDPAGTPGSSTTVSTTSTGVSFLQEDTTTEGNWIGTYGTQGYDIEGDAASLPSDASVSVSDASPYTWASSTTATSALENPSGSGRSATTWFNSGSFIIDVGVSGGQAYNLELYALDWDNDGRSEEIELINPVTGSVLNTQTISSFSNGVYLQWQVTGNVEIKVTRLAGANAVISGIFLDPADVSVTSTSSQEDTTTEGNWVGTYGSQGYDIEGTTASLPSYASVGMSGARTWTWNASTTRSPALENPSGSGRTATCWFGSSFTININVTDDQSYALALYAVDFDDDGRSEEIQLINPTTGAVESTVNLSSFTNGVYVKWDVTGNAEIKVTRLSGANAVISGLFFDPPTS